MKEQSDKKEKAEAERKTNEEEGKKAALEAAVQIKMAAEKQASNSIEKAFVAKMVDKPTDKQEETGPQHPVQSIVQVQQEDDTLKNASFLQKVSNFFGHLFG